jgi:hypothetical protein
MRFRLMNKRISLALRASLFRAIGLALLMVRPCMAQGTADELARAVREDIQLCSTPSGLEYELKFFRAITPTLVPALRACGTAKTFKFEMAFIVSDDGHIRRVLYTANQPVAACLAAKLEGKSVPRPPRDSWPVAGGYTGKP